LGHFGSNINTLLQYGKIAKKQKKKKKKKKNPKKKKKKKKKGKEGAVSLTLQKSAVSPKHFSLAVSRQLLKCL
jgi:predicted O-linked N-acetylglucosamine transferase (SPINDLY family)